MPRKALRNTLKRTTTTTKILRQSQRKKGLSVVRVEETIRICEREKGPRSRWVQQNFPNERKKSILISGSSSVVF